MQVIVLGETSDTADQAHKALTPLGVPVTPIDSLDDLGLALATAGPTDLLVVDLGGGLDGARVGEVVRRARFRGRVLALVRDFGRPGVGTLMVQGILARDFPLVQGCVLVVALSFVLINLVVDLLYAWLDPRIRYE